jgi:type II secretory pathway pseudopilin PulG
MNMKKQRRCKGLTLIEVILTVGILAFALIIAIQIMIGSWILLRLSTEEANAKAAALSAIELLKKTIEKQLETMSVEQVVAYYETYPFTQQLEKPEGAQLLATISAGPATDILRVDVRVVWNRLGAPGQQRTYELSTLIVDQV